MKIRLLLCVAAVICLQQLLSAQSTGERVKENAKNKTESKVNEKVDKAIDNIIDGNFLKKKKKAASETSADAATKIDEKEKVVTNGKTVDQKEYNDGFTVYSKFDFIAGEKVLYYDDFAEVAIGDFPTGWNTNSSAEIVRFNELPGKWLSITKDGFFEPEMVTNMPENFTLEFDVFNRYRSSNILSYNFIIYKSDNARRDIGDAYVTDASFHFNWAGCSGGASYAVYQQGEKMGSNDDLSAKNLVCGGDEYKQPATVKFSIWRQKNRLRIYVNEEKVLDIPQAFNSKVKYNVFKLGASYMNYSNGRENDDQFMVANLRYAVGAPDTRSKLITTGKFTTTGILFNVNADQIKAASYGTLKEIATVLNENPMVKVKIIGHTDSDGNDNANLVLSQKRALAVKEALSTTFAIEADRMQTDGKGAAEPVEPNSTPQGKANNRRVEFIKL